MSRTVPLLSCFDIFFGTMNAMLQMQIVPVVFRRAARRGLSAVFRERGWTTALGTLLGILLLGQMLILLTFGVQSGLDFLRQQTDLRLQIRDTATDVQIQDLIQNIRTLPYISDVVYVTREQAYERQKQRDPTLIEFLTKFGIDNPFPDTLGVRLRRLEEYGLFEAFLKQPIFSAVVDPSFLSETTDQKQQVEKLSHIVVAARTVLLFIVLLVFVVLLFVIVELVSRRALVRREELFVEQLVGASRLTTLLPFAIGIACLLSIALAVSLFFCGGVVLLLPQFIPALAAGGMFHPWAIATTSMVMNSLPWLVLVEFGIILLLSAFGTFLAFRPRTSLSLLPPVSL